MLLKTPNSSCMLPEGLAAAPFLKSDSLSSVPRESNFSGKEASLERLAIVCLLIEIVFYLFHKQENPPLSTAQKKKTACCHPTSFRIVKKQEEEEQRTGKCTNFGLPFKVPIPPLVFMTKRVASKSVLFNSRHVSSGTKFDKPLIARRKKFFDREKK